MADSPLKGFARSRISDLSEQLIQDLQRTAVKQDEEAVHKMRVSIRRFVQGLSVFKRQVQHNKSRKALKQLRPVLQRSSRVRDLDLAILFLKKHRRDAGELASRREQAGEKLAKAVSSDDWKVRLHWGAAEDSVANPGIVRAIVQKKLPPITADFFAAGRKAIKPGRTWHEMHKFRLAAKEFRYTLELFRPLFGPELEQRLEAVKKIQEYLGDINDAVSARKLLKKLDDTDSLREKLAQKAQARRAELISYWQGEFDALGELVKWKTYSKPVAARAKKTVQQKVRARA